MLVIEINAASNCFVRTVDLLSTVAIDIPPSLATNQVEEKRIANCESLAASSKEDHVIRETGSD